MVLKGVMTIELTDETTGAVETVTEENMITESVNNILGLNPMGIFYAATGQYDTALVWNDSLLPICPNMIGGILLFSKALTEDAANIYEMYDYSDVRVVNASFLRCNNISLTYNLPDAFLKYLGLENVAFSGSVSNPFMIVSKDYKGVDPEVATGGQPLSKVYSLRLNITF